MKRDILKYLKSYSYDTLKIDRLIVSAFIYSNELVNIKNNLIKDHLILEKDSDYENLQNFLKVNDKIDFEDLIQLFEYVISPAEKIVSGAVYTPKHIRDYIVNASFERNSFDNNLLVCDPACGCSGFLFSAAKKLKSIFSISYKEIFEKHIFGVDIQKYSVSRSKLLLCLLAIYEGEDNQTFNFNLYVGNSLGFNWTKEIKGFKGFDLIIGNPPYVCSRNIEEESRVLLKNWSVCSTGHPDLYIPFFEIGLELLKPNGILGYITMNSFFKSVNGRALREYFLNKTYCFSILDFAGSQVFSSKSTYTCICIIQNRISKTLGYKRVKDVNSLLGGGIEFIPILYKRLNAIKGWNLNKIDIIEKIESTGVPLGKMVRSSNGIATLKNNVYIFTPAKEDQDYYYRSEGDYLIPIEKNICKEIINPNRLIKCNSLTKIKGKLIFPYRHDNNGVKLISETHLKSKFPHTYDYLFSKKEVLSKRDKGNGNYENWYAFGRNQSLDKFKYKLFFPHISPSIPNYSIGIDENLYFHNGLAIIGKNKKELIFYKKLMSSRLFWFYIVNSSRLYEHGYFSLSKNYFKNFGVYEYSDNEIEYIINEQNSTKLNRFIEDKYNLDLSLL